MIYPVLSYLVAGAMMEAVVVAALLALDVYYVMQLRAFVRSGGLR